MTGWDLLTWVTIGVLGPGALVIFAAFLRDLTRPPTHEDKDGQRDEPG